LNPLKKNNTFLRKTFLIKKPENLQKNATNLQTSNVSKKLPDISKDSDNFEGNDFMSKDNENNLAKKTHKKTKAMDYKQYNRFLEKKELNNSLKISTENTTQTTINILTLDQLPERLNSKTTPTLIDDEKKTIRRFSWLEMVKFEENLNE